MIRFTHLLAFLVLPIFAHAQKPNWTQSEYYCQNDQELYTTNNAGTLSGSHCPIIGARFQLPNHAKEIAAFVIIKFTITSIGTTKNISVIESSLRGYERNAVRAGRKMKFRPRVSDGKAVEIGDMYFKFNITTD